MFYYGINDDSSVRCENYAIGHGQYKLIITYEAIPVNDATVGIEIIDLLWIIKSIMSR